MKTVVSVVQKETVKDYSDYTKVKDMVQRALENYLVSVYGTKNVECLIKPGMKVIIKPNLVHELNFLVRFDHIAMENPNDCFITNWNVIKAVIEIISVVKNITVTICECPLQSCNIEKIVTPEMLCELEQMYGVKVDFVDARRTKYIYGIKEPTVLHDLRSEDHYIDIDLKTDSTHCEYDDMVENFRVTDYPPDQMSDFHSKGKHIYRIAKEVMEADVVISVPKLKTHMKSGMTGAMKNFVGIVGNKECLPHHTKGSAKAGGDNYGDHSLVKSLAENLIDKANSYLLTDEKMYYKKRRIVNGLLRLRRMLGFDGDITGSWYGNDTISRTVVDLNRIIYYGGIDGRMHTKSQRRVLSLVDAIVSGQGEGPMRPRPNYTGFIAVSESTVAADAVCAELIGLDSSKIHYLYENRVVHEKYPLVTEYPVIDVVYNGRPESFEFVKAIDRKIVAPPRWEGKIEKHSDVDFTYRRGFLDSLLHCSRRILRRNAIK